MTTIGLIISAGKQTRFEKAQPKALSEFDGRCLLDLNIEHLRGYCDKVYVVCSYENTNWFVGYDKIEIQSGKGCGDAVMQAIEKFEDARFIIQWGDSYIDPYTLLRMTENYNSERLNIPVTYEENPYVSISESMVKFGKYGEVDGPGYHDCSIFMADGRVLEVACGAFCFKHKNGDNYEHKHGNEFTFLDIVNEGTLANLIEVPAGLNFAFNTVEELNAINTTGV